MIVNRRVKVVKIFFLFMVAFFAFSLEAAANDPIKDEQHLFKIISKSDYPVWINDAVETEDGFLLSASVFDDSKPGTWAWIIYFDKDWNVLWEKEIGRNEWDASFYTILSMDKNNVVLVGSVKDRIKGTYHNPFAWVVKLGLEDGRVEWDRRLSFEFTTRAMDILKTSGGMVVVGRLRDGYDVDSGFIMKLDDEGKTLWNRSVEDSHWFDLVSSFTGGFVVSSGNWVAMLNPEGKIVWKRTLEGIGKYHSTSHMITKDSGVILAGFKEKGKLSTIKFGSDGSTLWSKSHEIKGACSVAGTESLESGEITVVGGTCDEESERIWAALFSPEGELKDTSRYLKSSKCLDWVMDLGGVRISKDGGFSAFGSDAEVDGECVGGWVMKTENRNDQYVNSIGEEK